MQKISSQDASSLLKTAGATIRALSERNRQLEYERASFMKEAQIRKIAKDMEEKGLQEELPFEEKVAHLRQVPDLRVVEEAVKIASSQRGMIGSIAPDGEGPGGNAKSAFENFIMTGDSPE